MKSLRIRRPDDFHLHLRQGDLLRRVGPLSAMHFARGLVMPNTTSPILDRSDAIVYRDDVIGAADKRWGFSSGYGPLSFQPLMTIKLTPDTTPLMIELAKLDDVVIAAKLYPEGVTTNSAGGIRDIQALYPVFAAMQQVGMVLCLHGEVPGKPVLERELEFLSTLMDLERDFPKLKIVLEHVSTADGVQMVKLLSANVAATITAHHLVLTLDDVIGDGGLQPHHYCKPVAKSENDRQALLDAATSGNPKFFFGSDSAPHEIAAKENDHGAAGVFTAPVALPILATLFEQEGQLGRLEDFVSRFGAEFYGLPLNTESIWLNRLEEPWQVPHEYHGIVPLWAGRELWWKVSHVTGS